MKFGVKTEEWAKTEVAMRSAVENYDLRVVSMPRQRQRSDRSFGEGSLIADAPHSHLSECGAKLRIARAQLAVHRSSRDAERRAEQRSLGSSRPPQRTEGASIGHLVVSGGSHHKLQSAGSERELTFTRITDSTVRDTPNGATTDLTG